jgi:hypothetical protein
MKKDEAKHHNPLLFFVFVGIVLQFALAGALTGQVTINNTGSSGSSGIQMNNGASISASSTQVSIWADSSSTRAKINNGGFNGGGALPIATWPCTTATGGIVWGATAVSGVAVETCLGGNTSGISMLTENSTGTPSWVLAPLNTSSTAHKWFNSYTASTGVFGVAQPAISDLNATFNPPLSLSSNTLSITGAAGQVLAGSTPAFTAAPTLGVPNSSTGTLTFANGGSAFTITLTPASLSSANRTYTIPDGGGSSNIGLTAGTLTSGDYASWDANGNAKDSGATAGPYSIPWLTVPNAISSNKVGFSSTANQETLWGVVLTFPLTTTQVTYNVSTQDNSSNVYGLGILNSSGSIVVHLGPTAGSTIMTSGVHTVSWTEGSTTLQPGKYYLVVTSGCTSSCAQLYGANANALDFLEKSNVAITTGGTIKAITPPADSYSWVGTVPAWSVQ